MHLGVTWQNVQENLLGTKTWLMITLEGMQKWEGEVRDPSDSFCFYDLTLVAIWEGSPLLFFWGGEGKRGWGIRI